jgi:mono/diheme cytochrome c family protein
MRKVLVAVALGILLIVLYLEDGFTGLARRAQSRPAVSAREASVTPVEGPSWLKHLGLRVSETRLGEMGGGPSISPTPRREPDYPNRNNFAVTGADLFRINCRACHNPEGTGAPPEINSLIGPVQGMSPVLIRQRMKARGLDVDDSMVRDMAGQAEAAIRERLRQGGKKMPAFKYLRPDEVNALLAYLKQLAHVPGTRPGEQLVHESAIHMGEEVVKGTCHICHDATGPGGGRMQMMWGIIPSLASMPRERSLGSVVQQVEYGSRMMMMMGGERMPPLPYLTEQEVAAAYYYLLNNPPGAPGQ